MLGDTFLFWPPALRTDSLVPVVSGRDGLKSWHFPEGPNTS